MFAATCCLVLSQILGGKVAFSGSPAYNESVGSYFSAQEIALHPKCVVSPQSSDDVSRAVRVLTSGCGGDASQRCRFAIRSGGHASNAGAANMDGGVTIDLRGLDSIDVSPDRSSVSLGTGNTWDAVYARLEVEGLAVAGGRVAGIGVGGLSLGGGISWFGTRYGWTSDTISNFEVVLANGSVVNANKNDNPDLMWALRGGGNNFGIVTRIDMLAFEQEPFWGGFIYRPPSVWEEEVKEFVKINSAESYDEYAHLILAWGYTSDGAHGSTQIQYTKPGVENPAVFQGLRSIPALSESLDTNSTTQQSIAVRAVQAIGDRQLYVVCTLVSNQKVLNAVHTRLNESFDSIRDVSGIVWALALEPFPPALYARHAAANPFGLENRNDSLIVCLLSVSWKNSVDDTKIEEAARVLITAIEEDARRLDSWLPFRYINYAAPWQDPIASYGKGNVERLREIANKVDPHGVFTHQVPGGFKLK